MPIVVRPLTDDEVRGILLAPPAAHRHDRQEIVLFTQGGCLHEIDGAAQDLEAPCALLIARGKQHRLIPRSGTQGWVIHFEEALLPGSSAWMFSQFFASSSVALPEGAPASRVFELAELASALLERGGAGVEDAAAHLLLAMLALLQAKFQEEVLLRTEASCSDFRLFVECLDLVEAHYRIEKGPGFYADRLGVPIRRLLRLTHLFLGRTLKQLLEDRCLVEAKRLLYFTDTPIKVLVADLGYQDPSYFTKVFRKATGTTPVAFRQARRESLGD